MKPYCPDADHLRRRSSDLLAESHRMARSSATLEGLAYQAEENILDHCRECDLCQGKPILKTDLDALLGVI
jgi:hypothetical protein